MWFYCLTSGCRRFADAMWLRYSAYTVRENCETLIACNKHRARTADLPCQSAHVNLMWFITVGCINLQIGTSLTEPHERNCAFRLPVNILPSKQQTVFTPVINQSSAWRARWVALPQSWSLRSVFVAIVKRQQDSLLVVMPLHVPRNRKGSRR